MESLKRDAEQGKRKKGETRPKIAAHEEQLRKIRTGMAKEPQVRRDLERVKMSVEMLKIKLKTSRPLIKQEPIEEKSEPSLRPQARLVDNASKTAKTPKARQIPKSRSETSYDVSSGLIFFLKRMRKCIKCDKYSIF